MHAMHNWRYDRESIAASIKSAYDIIVYPI